MTKPLLLILAVAMLACPAIGQARLIVGATGGESYSNTFIGVDAKVEQPLGRRFELDAEDNYSPLEWHTGLGRGWTNQIGGGGLLWITRTFGLSGTVEDSTYSVTKLAKSSQYGKVSTVFRSHLGGAPLRVYLTYVRQFANGIDRRGVETNRLQAGEFRLEGRIGCAGRVCFRSITEFSVGAVLDQGNQFEDGSLGPNIHPRNHHLSGSGWAGFAVEWPRPKGHEYEAF